MSIGLRELRPKKTSKIEKIDTSSGTSVYHNYCNTQSVLIYSSLFRQMSAEKYREKIKSNKKQNPHNNLSTVNSITLHPFTGTIYHRYLNLFLFLIVLRHATSKFVTIIQEISKCCQKNKISTYQFLQEKVYDKEIACRMILHSLTLHRRILIIVNCQYAT